jgi:arylsulfatase A-like enzyme
MRVRPGQAAALAALLILALLASSGNRHPVARLYPRHYDFLVHAPSATVQTADPTYVRAGEVIPVAGQGRFCLFEHPDSAVTFPNVPVYQDGRLEFGIGIHQEAWGRPGDGVRFIVEVVDETGQAHRLYERLLDPYHRPADRDWFDERVDLRAFAGQRLQVVFRTEAGANPQNDWAAWSAPMLVSWEASGADRAVRSNILFITLDTVRADHLSAYGYDRQTSPSLDRLAREGTLFTYAYSHSDRTNPSHVTMLTGLYPRSHGVANNRTIVPLELTTIPERLRDAGYHTVGVVSAYHLGNEWNMGQGFADYYPPVELRRPAQATTDIALEWLIEQPREPFFMWVHYFDPHAPYLPPSPYDALYDPALAADHLPLGEVSLPADWTERYGDWPAADDVAEVIAQYDGAIAYTDAQVARLLSYLEESGLADRTVIIVTADHGEGFGEHGVAFDHYGLHEEMVHVPLIVRLPGQAVPGQVVQEIIGQIDLGPTFLDLAGLPIPVELAGTSLVPLLDGRYRDSAAAIIQQQHDGLALSVRTADWRMIVQQQDDDYWPQYQLQAGQVELYDLRADAGEKQNLWPASSPRARQAQAELSRLLLRWEEDTAAFGGTSSSLDQETEETLRRLGY